MKRRLLNIVGRTRVSRVQFGVPPNCVGACGFAFFQTLRQYSCVPPVSGATPETSRRPPSRRSGALARREGGRRVLPTAIENFRQV